MLKARDDSQKKKTTLDEYITDVCCLRTVGQLIQMAESGNSKAAWVGNTLLDAFKDQDIVNLLAFINRVDGLIPDEDSYDNYANYFGTAINEALEVPREELGRIYEDDVVMSVIAKCFIHVSLQYYAPSNNTGRKNKTLAIETILNRSQGRKIAPTKALVEDLYGDPDWMKSLPEGQEGVADGSNEGDVRDDSELDGSVSGMYEREVEDEEPLPDLQEHIEEGEDWE